MEYHKIETLFERNDSFKVTDKLKNPVYGIIKTWHVTEKIDGTNIRVTLEKEGKIIFGGKTDNASIPSPLLMVLMNMFSAEKLKEVFWKNRGQGIEPCKAILYGEGYGPGIQKGGSYRKSSAPTFRLFDVLIEDKWWLSWENTVDVAYKLGIQTVPFLGEWSLEKIVSTVKDGFPSVVAVEEGGVDGFKAEGIVGRPVEALFDKKGHRLILKLKTKDFTGKL